MTALLKSCLRDESGSTAMEYALIATVIAMALFTAISLVGTGAGNLFNTAANTATNSLNEGSSLLN